MCLQVFIEHFTNSFVSSIWRSVECMVNFTGDRWLMSSI